MLTEDSPATSAEATALADRVSRDGARLLDLPHGSTRKVLADPSAEAWSLSADGRPVAYHSRQSGERWGVWLMASRWANGTGTSVRHTGPQYAKLPGL